MPQALPAPRVRTLQASAAARRKFGPDSGAGGWEARWAALRRSRAVSQQRAEPPAQAQELAQVAAREAAQAQEPVQPVALVRERSSLVAGQRAATQLLGKGAAQHNRTTSGMRRLRLLKW